MNTCTSLISFLTADVVKKIHMMSLSNLVENFAMWNNKDRFMLPNDIFISNVYHGQRETFWDTRWQQTCACSKYIERLTTNQVYPLVQFIVAQAGISAKKQDCMHM